MSWVGSGWSALDIEIWHSSCMFGFHLSVSHALAEGAPGLRPTRQIISALEGRLRPTICAFLDGCPVQRICSAFSAEPLPKGVLYYINIICPRNAEPVMNQRHSESRNSIALIEQLPVFVGELITVGFFLPWWRRAHSLKSSELEGATPMHNTTERMDAVRPPFHRGDLWPVCVGHSHREVNRSLRIVCSLGPDRPPILPAPPTDPKSCLNPPESRPNASVGLVHLYIKNLMVGPACVPPPVSRYTYQRLCRAVTMPVSSIHSRDRVIRLISTYKRSSKEQGSKYWI